MRFQYYQNRYDHFYLFKRPDPEDFGNDALANFNKCVSYVGENENYPITGKDDHRQARIHTCFSYCRNGQEAHFAGDDRPVCVDLIPSERTSLICLYPEEECEGTTYKGQVSLNEAGTVNISVKMGIAAIAISNPLQLAFDVLCILLMKMKVN